MSWIRRALPVLLMLSAMGTVVACGGSAPTAPLTRTSSRPASEIDSTGKLCLEVEGERVCVEVHHPR